MFQSFGLDSLQGLVLHSKVIETGNPIYYYYFFFFTLVNAICPKTTVSGLFELIADYILKFLTEGFSWAAVVASATSTSSGMAWLCVTDIVILFSLFPIWVVVD